MGWLYIYQVINTAEFIFEDIYCCFLSSVELFFLISVGKQAEKRQAVSGEVHSCTTVKLSTGALTGFWLSHTHESFFLGID